LIQLCQFVFWSLMPKESGAGSRFKQILQNELRMSAVFESFLRNFFQLHRKEYRVRAESAQWDASEATEHDLAFLPRMLTDITLRHPDHTVIIDAKFYAKGPLVEGPYGERLNSDNLYQLITYLQHERLRQHDKRLAGMLLYAAAGKSV